MFEPSPLNCHDFNRMGSITPRWAGLKPAPTKPIRITADNIHSNRRGSFKPAQNRDHHDSNPVRTANRRWAGLKPAPTKPIGITADDIHPNRRGGFQTRPKPAESSGNTIHFNHNGHKTETRTS